MPQRTLSTAAFVLLFASSACESDSTWTDYCDSALDCTSGFSCDLGIAGGHCAMWCNTDGDCRGGSYCDHSSWFQSFDQCKRGCRSDAECGSGSICESRDCIEGCHEHTQCSEGLACIDRACAPGCRTDAECDSSSECLCGACVARGCEAQSDCGDGSFCPLASNSRCETKQCQALPPAVECGGSVCSASVVQTQFFFSPPGDMVFAPCCTNVGCGVDVRVFGVTGYDCQALGEPGTSDPACGDVKGPIGNYAGCKRSDGRCGFDPTKTFGAPSGAFGCLAI